MSEQVPDALKFRLTAHVHVVDPQTGVRHVFGPDDDVPRWARDQITNPKAWGLRPPKPRPVQHVVDVHGAICIDVLCHHGGEDSRRVYWYGESDRAGLLVARFERDEFEPDWSWVASLALRQFGRGASTDPSNGNVVHGRPDYRDARRVVRSTGAGGVDRVQLWCPQCGLGPRRGLWSSWLTTLNRLHSLAAPRVPAGAPRPVLVAALELSGLPANL